MKLNEMERLKFRLECMHRRNVVCAEWSNDEAGFKRFKKWCFENGYKPGLVIDRIDGTKGYSPDNCRFITQTENCRNRVDGHYYIWNGKRANLGEICEKENVSYGSVYYALKRGKSISQAINETKAKGLSYKKHIQGEKHYGTGNNCKKLFN